MRTCTVDGCDRKHDARGLCSTHYTRWQKYGDASANVPVLIYGNDWDRFWGKVDATGNCWEWTAYRVDGYGRFGVDGKSLLTHRVAYEFLVGPIPDGLGLDHLCRNHACVNPDHLEPVTQKVNCARGVGSGNAQTRKTHCKHGHPFTDDNTYRWRGHRQCKTCRRRHSAKQNQKRSEKRLAEKRAAA